MSPPGVLNGDAAFDIQADDKTLVIEPEDQSGNSDANSNTDEEKGQVVQEEFDWDDDPHNPYNWPSWRKGLLVFSLATMGLTVYVSHDTCGFQPAATSQAVVARGRVL